MKIKELADKYLSTFSKVCLGIFIISVLANILIRLHPTVAEGVTVSIGYFLRRILGQITSLLPFSIAEVLLLLSPLVITLLIAVILKLKDKTRVIRFFAATLAVLSCFYSLYVFTLGAGYNRITVAKKMELQSEDITSSDLYETYMTLKEQCELLLPLISFAEGGSSYTANTTRRMSKDISAAYQQLQDDYPELRLNNFSTVAKPVLISRAMSGFEILGIYSYFTGEANVNVHYPEYTTPFTIAHEFAHQRGIARENEANFIAYLAAIRADDPYIKYSGYMNMMEYLLSALYRADADGELYDAALSATDSRILGEIKAYAEFYKANKNQLMADISAFFNDNYLKSQGTEGVISYSLVVRLCVAYTKSAD